MSAGKPRLGFLGVGRIGRDRLKAMLATDAVEVAAVAEPDDEAVAKVLTRVPDAQRVEGLDGLLATGVDGVVIATPSAMHAAQSIQALQAGVAVFCQKPLGRTAAETRAVVEAARAADRLLSVDLSYRRVVGMERIKALLDEGALGRVRAVDLTFHNAYGPDKPWFYDPALSGGGCVVDLGVHLVDLALWSLGWPEVVSVESRLFGGGALLGPAPTVTEDLAFATLTLATGAVVRLACSWHLHAGTDAVIESAVYGTDGGARLANNAGSFFDFAAERFRGTAREPLGEVDGAWGGRAAADWALRLAAGARFDPDAERLVDVAAVLDRIYGR